MVRGNVHKVTEVFWPKKYCALKALREMLFVLEEKFIIRVKYEFNDSNACIKYYSLRWLLFISNAFGYFAYVILNKCFI